MAVALAWLLLRDPVAPQPAVAPSSTSTTSDVADTSTSGVATTPAPAPTTTVAATSPADSARIVAGLDDALAAWGRFIISGDMTELDGYLVENGPQWQQLAAESTQLAAEPLGLPPYTFDLDLPQVVEHAGAMAVVRSELVMSRPGETPQRFDWLITLQEVDGRWLLYTVDEA